MDFFGADKGCRDRGTQKAEMTKAQNKKRKANMINWKNLDKIEEVVTV